MRVERFTSLSRVRRGPLPACLLLVVMSGCGISLQSETSETDATESDTSTASVTDPMTTPGAPGATPGAPGAMPGAVPGAPGAVPGAPAAANDPAMATPGAVAGAPGAVPGAPGAATDPAMLTPGIPGAPGAVPVAAGAVPGAPGAVPGAPGVPGAPVAMPAKPGGAAALAGNPAAAANPAAGANPAAAGNPAAAANPAAGAVPANGPARGGVGDADQVQGSNRASKFESGTAEYAIMTFADGIETGDLAAAAKVISDRATGGTLTAIMEESLSENELAKLRAYMEKLELVGRPRNSGRTLSYSFNGGSNQVLKFDVEKRGNGFKIKKLTIRNAGKARGR